MAISYRYFVFEDGGALKHVPRRVSEGLHAGEDAIPEYAGTKQRLAEVVIENEEGRAVRILDARGRYWAFDQEGRLDRDARFSFMRWYDPFSEKPKGKVVDLRPDLERRKWQRENFWDLTADDLDRVAAAVWPGATDGSAISVKAVKSKAHKVPPLTNDGREALSEIVKGIGEIGAAIEKLSEPALKGVAYELRRCGMLYQAEQGFYEAAAAAADHQREIKARHRTGKGAWYACLHVWRWNEDRSEGREIDTIEERCATKPEAIIAARRLLTENAHRFELGLSFEADVISELEWVPMKAERPN